MYLPTLCAMPRLGLVQARLESMVGDQALLLIGLQCGPFTTVWPTRHVVKQDCITSRSKLVEEGSALRGVTFTFTAFDVRDWRQVPLS